MTIGVETEIEILWLGEAACHDHTMIGGKAAQLSRLAAGNCVPPGFCLTPAAFAAARTNGRTGNGIGNSPVAVPQPLFAKLTTAYQTLGARTGLEMPPVAVRSSAIDEDGSAAHSPVSTRPISISRGSTRSRRRSSAAGPRSTPSGPLPIAASRDYRLIRSSLPS